MMIGNKNLHAEARGFSHAFHAGDTVIYCNQYIWTAYSVRKPDDLWREAISVFKAIRDEIVYDCAELPQPAYADGTSGSAIRIIVRDYQHALTRGDCFCDKSRHLAHIFQVLEWDQSRPVHLELRGFFDTARGIDAR
jgi:hypothetical protein